MTSGIQTPLSLKAMEALLPYFLDFEKEIAQNKDPVRVKAFWAKLAWEMESCAEAKKLFPAMTLCPVCMTHEEDGTVFHKPSGWLKN